MSEKHQGREALRQQTLAALEILDTAPEADFDAVVKAARRIFDCRIAYVSLIDGERQWFKAREGLSLPETPRDCSICALAVERGQEIVVEDLRGDPVFGNWPIVSARPDLRFLATIPLLVGTMEGSAVPIGTLCAIDGRPRVASEDELAELRQLGQVLESLLRARLEARLARTALAERKALVEDLHRTQRQFELAEQMAQIGHWRMDLASGKVFGSPHAFAIHGLDPSYSQPLEGALDYYLPHDRPRMAAAVAQCRADGTPYDLELDFRDAQGILKRVRAIGEVEELDGRPVALIGVFQDVTERYHLETRLRTAAHVDDLTGLPNRARLNQYLEDTIISKRKHNKPLAVILIDLDHFKEVNDQLGHEAGDQVLKEVAAQLVSEPFAGQLAARLGGDEFVLVVEDEALLANLQATLETLLGKLRFEVGREERSLPVSATLGAAWLTGDNDERSALLRCADHALYQAKRAERGTAAICPDAIAGERVRARPHLRAVG